MSDKPSKATRYVLLTGNHYRRGEDGRQTRYRPGALLELTADELTAFGDKFCTEAEFRRRAAELEDSELQEGDRAEAAERLTQEARPEDAPTEPEQAERAAVIERLAEVEREKHVRFRY